MRPLHVALFLLSAVLIGRAAIIQNFSSLDLPKYEHQQEVLPFQARYMMVPVLRWAASSPIMVKAAVFFKQSTRGPEDLMMQGVDASCLIVMGFLAVRLRNLFLPQTIYPWLAPWLLLWIVVCEYIARYESRFYLPYDFPAALFFALGIVAAVEYRPFVLFLIVLLGSYNRETCVMLIPIWLTCSFDKNRWKKSLLWAFTCLLGWAFARVQISHWLGRSATSPELSYPWMTNMHLLIPHHWPQVFSAGGFLLIMLWVRRDLIIDTALRTVWLGCIPFILSLIIFGWWNETRIMGELNVLVAVTAATAFERHLRETSFESNEDGEVANTV